MNSTKNTFFFIHLKELRFHFFLYLITFILTFITCYFFINEILYILIKPLLSIKDINYFIFTNVTEILIIKIIITTYITFYFLIPFLLLQIWFFLKKGLYKSENMKLKKLIKYFFLSYLISIIFSYFFIIPITLKQLLSYGENNDHSYLYQMYLEPSLVNYSLFIIKYFFIINFLLQFPLLFYLLIISNIIEINTLIKLKKLIYLFLLLISAIISPPDIISQLIISLPLLIIFEIFLFLFFIVKQYENK